MLFRVVIDKHTDQVVHALVLFFSLILVNVQLFTKEAVPILLELALAGFTNHFTFKLNAVIISKSNEFVESWTSTIKEGTW